MIYFVQRSSDHLIKIGASINVPRRMTQLAMPRYRLALLGVCIGSYGYEKSLHTRFKTYQIQGEWFQPAQPIFDFIEKSTVRWNIVDTPGTGIEIVNTMRFDIEAFPEVRRYNQRKEHEENARKYQEWLHGKQNH